MIRILVTCPLNAVALEQLNEIPEFEISERPGITPDQMLDEIRGADALVCGGSPAVSGPALAAAAGLKLIVDIGMPGRVDLETAQCRRIEVSRVNEDRMVEVLKDFFNV